MVRHTSGEVDGIVEPNERESVKVKDSSSGFWHWKKCWLESIFQCQACTRFVATRTALNSALILDRMKQALKLSVIHHLLDAVKHPMSLVERRVKGVNVVRRGPPRVERYRTTSPICAVPDAHRQASPWSRCFLVEGIDNTAAGVPRPPGQHRSPTSKPIARSRAHCPCAKAAKP